MKKDEAQIVDFLFEVGILAETPRSFYQLLGTGRQSVAEHIHRVVYIGYVLGMMDKSVDMAKLLKMCLLHDLPEARTSDLHYVHQKYAMANEGKALKELTAQLPFGEDIANTVEAYNARKTKEAKLAKDADQLELILSLKEQVDRGNTRAGTWLPSAVKRLKTASAKKLAQRVLKTDSDNWWFADKDDEWWVTRGETK